MPRPSATTSFTIAAALTLAGCGSTTSTSAPPRKEAPKLTRQPFGTATDGAAVDLYTLKNAAGMEVRITNYGGIVTSLKAPDKAGVFADVVLGFDSLEGYLKTHPYFGALIGRYGNRIAKGQFKLNGATYKLAVNNGANALHGGLKGFDKQVWAAKELPESNALELTYVSKDGEEGYPGTLTTTVTYTLTEASELRIGYAATTDKDTVLNLTNHSYFNLKGAGEGDILGHRIMIDADRFTPVDAGLIPTGELRPVEGTPFDFRKPEAIGARIGAADQQIQFGGGYDHNYALNGAAGTLRKVVEVHEPTSGRLMEVSTDQPGVQFYTGNFLDGSLTGKGGKIYQKRYGFCLETQHFPDSPNQKAFPSVVLKPGERYQSTTVYKFSLR
ncbi:MAG: aldose epimerase family protein [Bryobacteraceae bacterium]|nr:aldose epimerase family protein [Bryobacteraceae bacterium]